MQGMGGASKMLGLIKIEGLKNEDATILLCYDEILMSNKLNIIRVQWYA